MTSRFHSPSIGHSASFWWNLDLMENPFYDRFWFLLKRCQNCISDFRKNLSSLWGLAGTSKKFWMKFGFGENVFFDRNDYHDSWQNCIYDISQNSFKFSLVIWLAVSVRPFWDFKFFFYGNLIWRKTVFFFTKMITMTAVKTALLTFCRILFVWSWYD